MEETGTIQNRLWNTELEIMDVIHAFCEENGIRYSLADGSAIGAVRHHGFIPWDDDLDICMPRADYERFLYLWEEKHPEGYFLQHIRTEPDFTQIFSKIRKDHTAFLHDEEEKTRKYHKGIFVDVVPQDRVAPTPLGRIIQYAACAVWLLYSREKRSGACGIIGAVETALLHLPRAFHTKFRNIAEKIVQHWNQRGEGKFFSPTTIERSRMYYPSSFFDRLELTEFSGRQYYLTSCADEALRVQYGDYMQLPPEEERVWKHHPIIIDFEHNFEELENT